MDIIPAIDLMDGSCVRLHQGEKNKKQVFSNDPPRVAAEFQAKGAHRLHLIDLDGAFSGEVKNLPVIEQIIKSIDIPVQVGGGLREMDKIARLFDIGVDRVILGTKAFMDENFLENCLREFKQRIVVGVDVREKKVSIKGWTETSNTEIETFISYLEKAGLKRVIITDISKDGALSGPNVYLLQDIIENTGMNVILSGGISSLEDLKTLVKVDFKNFEGVIVGTSLYKGKFTLEEAMEVSRN